MARGASRHLEHPEYTSTFLEHLVRLEYLGQLEDLWHLEHIDHLGTLNPTMVEFVEVNVNAKPAA